MLETTPNRLTLQSMKNGPDEDYREYAVRWKNAASMVRPSLTSREENSMFVDVLPSLYYDMLVVNAFVEFKNLMYFVGRIEDGIRKGKIMDTGASMMEKRKSSSMNMYKRCLKKEEAKENRIRHEKSRSRIILVYHGMPKTP